MKVEFTRPTPAYELEDLSPGMVFELNGVAQMVLEDEYILDLSEYKVYKLDDMIATGRFYSKGGRPIEVYEATLTLR